jgi:cysteinyl-tRNA synthetase
VDDAAADLVRQRDQARADRDWPRADALRAELEAGGWLVEDSAEGTRIRRR